jgi:hypothetical protein
LLQPNRIVAEHGEASIIREIGEHEIAGLTLRAKIKRLRRALCEDIFHLREVWKFTGGLSNG